MRVHEIKAPDGQIYDFEATDTATPDQVLAKFKEHYYASQKGSVGAPATDPSSPSLESGLLDVASPSASGDQLYTGVPEGQRSLAEVRDVMLKPPKPRAKKETPVEDPGMRQKAHYGITAASNVIGNVAGYFGADPYAKEGIDKSALADRYMQETLSKGQAVDEQYYQGLQDIDREKNRQTRQANKQDFLEIKFPDIHGTEYAESLPALAGGLANNIFLDPLTYVAPWLKYAKTSAFALGAGSAGTDYVLRTKEEEGKVDLTTAGLVSLTGGVLSAGVVGLLQKFGSKAGEVAEDTIPVGGMVDEAVPAAPPITPQITDLPVQTGRFQPVPGIAEQAQIASTMEGGVISPGRVPGGAMPPTTQTSRLMSDVVSPKAAQAIAPDAMDGVASPSALVARRNQQIIDDVMRIQQEKEAAWAIQEGAKRELQKNAPIRELLEQIGEDVDNIKNEADFGRIQVKLRLKNNQLGSVDRALLNTLATSSIGAAGGGVIGGMVGGEEGAIYGALLGGGATFALPKMLAKMPKSLPGGKLSLNDTANFISSGRYNAAPINTWRRFGRAGEEAADRFSLARGNIEERFGYHNEYLSTIFEKLGPKQSDNLLAALSTPRHVKTLNASEKSAHGAMRTWFNDILDDATETGIITPERAAALRANAEVNGYLPRVLDIDFLDSSAGAKLWNQKMAGIMKDEASSRAFLEKVIGRGQSMNIDDLVADVLKGKSYARKTFEVVRRKMIEEAHQNRSRHLEHSRTLKLPDEFLNDFMIKDPKERLMRYAVDVTNRIEFARQFDENGIQDEVFRRLASEMEQTTGSKEVREIANTTYLTAVRSYGNGSTILQAYANLEPLHKAVLKTGNTASTWLLGGAAITNILQGFNVSSLRLAKAHGATAFLDTHKATVKAFARAFTKMGRKRADRTGAIMDAMGYELAGATSHNSRSFAKFLTDPKEYLKMTFFTATEKFNRRFAGLQTIEWVNDMIAKKQLIDAGRLTGKAKQNVLDQMTYLMMDTKTPIAKMTEAQLDRMRNMAANKVSHDVNFADRVEDLPLFAQGPDARLILKFKSYAFKYGNFLFDNLMAPALKGNFKPLINHLAVLGALGAGKNEIQKMIADDDENLTVTRKWLDGVATLGTMGLLQEVANAGMYGDRSALGTVVGPFGSGVYKTAMAGVNPPEGRNAGANMALQAAKSFAPNIPYVKRKLIQGGEIGDTGVDIVGLEEALLGKRDARRIQNKRKREQKKIDRNSWDRRFERRLRSLKRDAEDWINEQ